MKTTAKVEPVTLEWFVARCEVCADADGNPWVSNPTPDAEHAQQAADHHNATEHA